MSDKKDDVFEKFDALVNKHTRVEPDFPVLTDVIEPPRIDLDAIPVLTEEIDLDTPSEIELELVPEPAPIDALMKHVQTQQVLEKLDVAEAEIQAEVEARIQRSLKLPETPHEAPMPALMEIPQGAAYLPVMDTVATSATQVVSPTAAPSALNEDTAREIAALLEGEISRMVKTALQQALAQELPKMMNAHLDKALSSMLDQHIMMLQETVRGCVADEFAKQIAPFRKQPPKP